MSKMGENIKALRLKSRLTQQQVANLLNVDKSTVSKIERGETQRISDEQMNILCKAFQCSPSDIYGIETFKYTSSVALTDTQQELLLLIPMLNDEEAKALLEMAKAMFGYKRHASI